MKIVKYIFFLLLILFIGVAIYFGTQDGRYSVSESRVIGAPAEMVNEVVFDFSEKGILKTDAPGADKTDVKWGFEEENDSIRISQEVSGELELFQKFTYTVQRRDVAAEIGEQYRKNLEIIDSTLQERINRYNIKTEAIVDHDGVFYLYEAATINKGALAQKFPEMLSSVRRAMKVAGVAERGKPFTIYTRWEADDPTADISVCVPTGERVEVGYDSPVLSGVMPPTRALKTTLKGKYDYTAEAWKKAWGYIAEKALPVDTNKAPFEVYRIGPEDDVNPANWTTDIYIPLIQ